MSESKTVKEVKLKVAEAVQEDVNKGIVRIDSTYMREIDVRPGDFVELEGGRKTYALADRAFPSDIGLDFIRMDGLARKNAKTSIGEQLTVRKADVKEAKKLTIAPAREGIIIKASPGIFRQGLLGRALAKGDLVSMGGTRRRRNMLSGSQFFDEVFNMMEDLSGFGFVTGDIKFVVVDTNPKGAVVVTSATDIALNPEAADVSEDELPGVSYEDIGGLDEEVKKIREMVELPLKHPEIFERLGVDPPKGVLLHGPPGTGKTLLAKAVANETNAHFISIAGPEVMSKYYGQSLPGDEEILVVENGQLMRKPIADVVAEEKATHVPCFGKDGKVTLGKVTGFIKHPFHGRLMRVKTASGRSIRVTDYHSLFTLGQNGITDVKTSELTPGESFIAIPKSLPFPEQPLTELNLLPYLANDDYGLVVRGAYAEGLVRDSIAKIGRERAAAVLGTRVKYTYDLLGKHVGIRLNKFLALAKEAGVAVDPYRLTLSTKGKGLPAVLPLSEALCRFFGLWLAEGSYTNKNEVRITVHESEVDYATALCTSLFDKVTTYRKYAHAADILVCSGVLGKVMRALGFPSGARNKRVPAFAYNLSQPQLAAFLQGYISGDGSVNRATPAPQVEVSTESPGLAEDICHLLLFFGIVPKVYGRPNRPQRRICFADAENLARFRDIGFIDAAKNSMIAQYLAKAPARRRDRVPLAAVEGLLGAKASAWKGLSSIGVDVVGQQLQAIPAELQPALEGDITWDKVVAVEGLEDKPEYVYDISVEPCQNFIAGNGIFAHNSEENLRKKFEEAEKNAPSIIFIDEIDAIAGKREETRGEVERRVVAQLLAIMDGLKARGKVVVIAATNMPNALDPALRRPGRFDRELEIGVPNKEGRLAILKIHTRNMPLTKDVSLDELAAVTHGFVGADVSALTKEAAMTVLRRLLPALKLEKDEALPKELLDKLIVTKADFREALRLVRPSALREVLVEIPNVHWEDIGGLEDCKQELREAVEWPLKHPHAFRRLGVRPPKGILIYGAPGTGKTLLAKAVAHESEANFISVKGPELLSKWVGESEKAVREVFKKARQTAPCIVFFDEVDALAPRRGMAGDNFVTERVVNQLLTEIDGLQPLHDIVIIGATNRPDIVDPALLRPGRFDRIILSPVPDEAARLAVLQVHSKDMPLKGVKLDEIAKATDGYVGADLEAVCREAAILALREDINAEHVTMPHFEKAMAKVRPSAPKDVEQAYEQLKDQFGSAKAKEMQRESPGYFG